MKLEIIKSKGLAHNSYYISDKGEAAVIDPRRDCQIYLQLAKKDCAEIKYILETHRNEDYVIGSLELQNMVDAKICHSGALAFKYGDQNLADGDTLQVGSLQLKVLYTPGHTDESLCYVMMQSGGAEPLMVFTGDTLFAGSVGRTDLYGKEKQAFQAEKLYLSLHQKLLPIGDHVLVYPAHGAGSVCGSHISSQEPTTIGFEKKTNPYLQLNQSDFISMLQSQLLWVPRYFSRMEELNLKGPPLLANLAYPRPMTLQEFKEHMQLPYMIAIDTRNPNAFNGSHIPGSINIWLNGSSVYPGWLFDINQYIIFVHERTSDISQVAAGLRRIGFDNMCGYLCGGMNQWQNAGELLESVGTMHVTQLKDMFASGEVEVLDVREPREWMNGVIADSKLIFFADLPQKAGLLSKDIPLAVICTVGNRTSIAASLLKREGFKKVYNVLGGVAAWRNLGYPTVIPNSVSI